MENTNYTYIIATKRCATLKNYRSVGYYYTYAEALEKAKSLEHSRVEYYRKRNRVKIEIVNE